MATGLRWFLYFWSIVLQQSWSALTYMRFIQIPDVRSYEDNYIAAQKIQMFTLQTFPLCTLIIHHEVLKYLLSCIAKELNWPGWLLDDTVPHSRHVGLGLISTDHSAGSLWKVSSCSCRGSLPQGAPKGYKSEQSSKRTVLKNLPLLQRSRLPLVILWWWKAQFYTPLWYVNNGVSVCSWGTRCNSGNLTNLID